MANVGKLTTTLFHQAAGHPARAIRRRRQKAWTLQMRSHLGKSAHCSGFASSDSKLISAAEPAGYDGVREVAWRWAERSET
jgi:hypothetical protein